LTLYDFEAPCAGMAIRFLRTEGETAPLADPVLEIETSDLVPLGSPRILIHARAGKIAGIYCDQPPIVLEVETQDRLSPPSFRSALLPRPLCRFGGGRH
jgi:hypothetical protein